MFLRIIGWKMGNVEDGSDLFHCGSNSGSFVPLSTISEKSRALFCFSPFNLKL